jgi:glucose-fructose oxidoreductase
MIDSDDRAANDRIREVRFAVVGLGHIAQVAVLPAFEHASQAKLAAIVSSDPVKRVELGERYQIEHCIDYDGMESLIEEGFVDAVYLAVPNHRHCDLALRAARAGAHVLCEKPMAVTERECDKMLEASSKHGVKLMVAYRLHFAEAHMAIVEHCRKATLGDLRLFSSVFTQDVKPGDMRLAPIDQGGGSLYDMGIYCINAARYLFRDEPIEVSAQRLIGRDDRFAACDEATSAVLRFPGDRLASFTSSFGAQRTSSLRLVGTEGFIAMDSAYEYADALSFEVHRGDHVSWERFDKSDQFAPELVHFCRCIVEDREPEPGGLEGLADVRIIAAIHQAAETGKRVALDAVAVPSRPEPEQAMWRPAVSKPDEIHASGPSSSP